MEAIDFTQSPQRTTVHAGAILAATGCEPAPEKYYDYLGYGHDGVVTQVELAGDARRLDRSGLARAACRSRNSS